MLRWLACACSICFATSPYAATPCSDVAIVLAIDASGSIDPDEFLLQSEGYQSAFRSPSVQRALALAGVVDLAAVFWADPGGEIQVIPWNRVRGPRDAEAFGAEFGKVERRIGGDTGLGAGIFAALALLKDPLICTARAVIDVSGDGRASNGPSRRGDHALATAQKVAAGEAVTINGLAITNGEHDLAEYYQHALVTGPGAFVVEASDFPDLADAIVRKLVRELHPRLVASIEAWRPPD